MRAQWERVRQALIQSTVTLETEHLFRDFRATEPQLSAFPSSSELVHFLASAGGDLDEKDAIYSALVRIIQARSTFSEVATPLVWLGLWPRLDGLYRQHLRFFAGASEDLVSELSDLFTAAVARADLSRMRRPGATLLLNVKRDLRRRLRRTWAEERRRADLPEDDLLDTDGVVQGPWAADPSPETDSSALRDWLDAVVGRDADLIERVLVYGESQREAAAHLGLTHAATRKRYRRALDRLSHFVTGAGVSRMRGARPP